MRFLLLLIFLLLIENGNAQNSGQTIGFHFKSPTQKRLKMKYKRANNLIIVPCILNNKDKDTLNFVLDTGVSYTLITDTFLKYVYNLNCNRTIKINGLGGKEPIEACVANIDNISIGGEMVANLHNVVILNDDVLHISEYAGMKIHGLIGADLFQRFVVHLRYTDEFLMFEKPEYFKVPSKKYKELPITIEAQKPYLLADLVLEKDSLANAKFLLDTGAGHSLLLEQDSDKAIQIPTKNLEGYLGVSLSGVIKGHIGRVKKMVIKDIQLTEIITNFPDTASIKASKGYIKRNGNIGSGIMKKFHWIFDYSRNKVWIKKNHYFKDRFEFSTSGLEIVGIAPTYQTFAIGSVRENSPAEKAGLEKGDEFIFIETYKVTELNINQAYNLINKKSGKKVVCVIRRNGLLMAKTLITEEPI